MVLVTCTRKKPLPDGSLCRNQWDYKGSSTVVAHCSKCKTTVMLAAHATKGRQVELRERGVEVPVPV